MHTHTHTHIFAHTHTRIHTHTHTHAHTRYFYSYIMADLGNRGIGTITYMYIYIYTYRLSHTTREERHSHNRNIISATGKFSRKSALRSFDLVNVGLSRLFERVYLALGAANTLEIIAELQQNATRCNTLQTPGLSRGKHTTGERKNAFFVFLDPKIRSNILQRAAILCSTPSLLYSKHAEDDCTNATR